MDRIGWIGLDDLLVDVAREAITKGVGRKHGKEKNRHVQFGIYL